MIRTRYDLYLGDAVASIAKGMGTKLYNVFEVSSV